MKITKNYILILYFINLFLVSNSFADITQTDNLNKLKELIDDANQDCLVIFDVDHVLMMPSDEFTINRHPYRKKLWQEILSRHTKEKIKKLYSITASNAKWILVDSEIMPIFYNLQRRNIPSIALSSIYTGKFGNIEKLEDWRVEHMRNIGFDFTTSSPFKGELYIPELAQKDGIPVLKAGVILTAQIDKASVLEYILKHYHYYPKKIIFIDDQIGNIESLEAMCQKLKIEFDGVHYIAVSKMPLPLINEDIEKIRFKILETKGLWLSISEVEKLNMRN